MLPPVIGEHLFEDKKQCVNRPTDVRDDFSVVRCGTCY